MKTLNLKPTHKPIKNYYAALDQFDRLGVTHETTVRLAFQSLLQHYGGKLNWTLVPEYPINRQGSRIVVDGALIDIFNLNHGFWEAKDIHDDLPSEVMHKFEAGYPRDNILFQTPHRAILWQNAQPVLDADLTNSKELIGTLETFFSHRAPEYTDWEEAVAHFKTVVPELGESLANLIQSERASNDRFKPAFRAFYEKCRQAINPNLSEVLVGWVKRSK